MFAPSLHAERGDGVKVVRQDYPVGVAGVRLSLETMAERMREGRLSKKVMGWSMDQLLAAGIDGRSPSHTNFLRGSCLLDAVRKATIYTPDPPDTEYVKSAEAMLCLREGLCVRGGDCDDQVVLLGSCLMSVGIPVRIIKQTFGDGDQEHVLLEAQAEDGSWFPLDPSTNLAAGKKLRARQEYRVDPMNPSTVGLTGAPNGELVSVGKPKACGDNCCQTEPCGSCASEGKPGRGMGAAPTGPVLPASVEILSGPYVLASRDLQNEVVLPIQAGDTYFTESDFASALKAYRAAGTAGVQSVGPDIDMAGAANVTAVSTSSASKLNDMLQALAAPDAATAEAARNLAIAMVFTYQTAMTQGQAVALATLPGKVPTLTPQMTAARAGLWILGGGTLLGVAWSLAHRPPRRKRR